MFYQACSCYDVLAGLQLLWSSIRPSTAVIHYHFSRMLLYDALSGL
jgi:hypothetical protein